MSAVADNQPPLGGFEQRLLTQLRAQVAAPPAAATTAPGARYTTEVPAKRRVARRMPRLSFPAAALIGALITAALTLLPAATPSLAQAFPILSGPTRELPAGLARVLRIQWRAGVHPVFDLRHAHVFNTPAGTGYVIIDQRTRWLCILVPSFGNGTASGRCERVTLARLGRPPLTLRLSLGGGRQEIVGLLPRGGGATAQTGIAGNRRLALRNGVLAIVTHGPVTITTSLRGQSISRTTYRP